MGVREEDVQQNFGIYCVLDFIEDFERCAIQDAVAVIQTGGDTSMD